MIRVNFLRKEFEVECDGCKTSIVDDPFLVIELGAEQHEEMCEEVICLCKQCYADLSNALNSEI